MSESAEMQSFRAEVGSWVKDNFPQSLVGVKLGMEEAPDPAVQADLESWRQRLAERGYGAPTWPKQYGGAGLSHPEAKVLGEEMAKAGAR